MMIMIMIMIIIMTKNDNDNDNDNNHNECNYNKPRRAWKSLLKGNPLMREILYAGNYFIR